MDDAVEYIASTHWALLEGEETTLPHVYEWGVSYVIVIVGAVAAGSMTRLSQRPSYCLSMFYTATLEKLGLCQLTTAEREDDVLTT